MEIRKICLGHGKVMEFQIFDGWTVKKFKKILRQASKRSAGGDFEVMELD